MTMLTEFMTAIRPFPRKSGTIANYRDVILAALPLLQCKEQTLAQLSGANSRELIRLLTLYGKASCSRPGKPDP